MALAQVDHLITTANNPLSGNFGLGTEGVNWNPGDLAIFWWYGRGSAHNWTDNSGGKLTVLQNLGTSTSGTCAAACRILVTGDVATDFAWTNASSVNSRVVYGTIVISGADGTTPISAEIAATTFTNSASPDPGASITIGDDGSWVLSFYGKNAIATTNTDGLTLIDQSSDTNVQSGWSRTTKNVADSPFNPPAWGSGAASDDGCTYALVVKPAAAGGGGATNPGWYIQAKGGWW